MLDQLVGGPASVSELAHLTIVTNNMTVKRLF